MTLLSADVWNIVLAVLTALGGGGAIVVGFSSWLGKLWAERLLEAEKGKIQRELAELKADLDKRIHAHNVAASRIDSQRVDAIRELYGALIAWHEAVWEIVASNKLQEKPHEQAIAIYGHWSDVLRAKSEALERVAMSTAIFFSEETYQLIAKCGMSASFMSIDFIGAVRNSQTPNTPQHLAAIEAAKTELAAKYKTDYEPARGAVVAVFRRIVDPTTPAAA